MNTLIATLVATVAPPPGRTSPFRQWDELQSRLGAQVPEDYRKIVEAYGAGCFDEFLHILQPKSHFEAVKIIGRTQSFRQRLQAQIQAGRAFPYSPAELLPAAVTEDGDTISWVMNPEHDPSNWKLVANNFQREEWDEFDGSLNEFLVGVYERRVRMPFFPDDFPLPRPEFKIYPTVDEARAIYDRLTGESGVAE